jgi:sugar lactone lactonase YvrE
MERRSDVLLVHDAGALLGEGPAWDDRTGTLLWVDILGRVVHRLDPVTGTDDPVRTPLDVGAAVPRRDGGLALALQDGFWLAEPDGRMRRVAAVEADDPQTRFNDGKCDARGRFWAGTMEYAGAAGRGSLYRLDPDGSVRKHLTGVSVSNGLAWTSDRRTMYYIDSLAWSVDAFDFDDAAGIVSGRRQVLEFPRTGGVPDGMAIDEQGCLWVAFYGDGCVRRYDPASGATLLQVDLPTPHITSCAFGGPDLGELYITSARQGLDDAGRARYPAAGGLFRFGPGVRGTPTEPFAG